MSSGCPTFEYPGFGADAVGYHEGWALQRQLHARRVGQSPLATSNDDRRPNSCWSSTGPADPLSSQELSGDIEQNISAIEPELTCEGITRSLGMVVEKCLFLSSIRGSGSARWV